MLTECPVMGLLGRRKSGAFPLTHYEKSVENGVRVLLPYCVRVSLLRRRVFPFSPCASFMIKPNIS